jgi:lysophospholipase L1-like esterase
VLSFRHPAISPIPLPLLRQLHELFDRNTIQVMPECAVYNDRLTYTLRPGQCTFSNREFSNIYRINRLGVRDDELSLRQPSVVMLGDSITMGWGVEQEEAFPSVFERLTRQRTLNAGVSSYGTVRELRMLELVDRRSLTDVVIQYSANDRKENQSFADGTFRILSREQYESTVTGQAELLEYHPGKHALNLMVTLRNATRDPTNATTDTQIDRDAEVRAFLHVLENSPVDLAPFRVTVIAIDTAFIERARTLALASPSPVARGLRFIDLTAAVSIPGAFYRLDGHPTKFGHESIARALVDVLARSN